MIIYKLIYENVNYLGKMDPYSDLELLFRKQQELDNMKDEILEVNGNHTSKESNNTTIQTNPEYYPNNNNNNQSDPIITPERNEDLLTEEEAIEAAKMKRIAERAELRALERQILKNKETSNNYSTIIKPGIVPTNTTTTNPPILPSFATLARLSAAHAKANEEQQLLQSKTNAMSSRIANQGNKSISTNSNNNNNNNKRGKFANRFKFEWGADEDTSTDALDTMMFDNNTTTTASTTNSSNNRQNRMMAKAAAAAATTKETTTLPPTHWRNKTLDQMTGRDWAIVREDYQITVKRGPAPPPIRSWQELEVPSHLKQAIASVGYSTPTPIQMQAIPCGLQFRDMIGLAETGSGKTCAFVVPLIVHVERSSSQKRQACSEHGPLAIILAPTRELAQQIEEEIRRLSTYMQWPTRSISIHGGVPIESQAFILRQGCDVICATPGRLIECLESFYVVLNQCSYVVLDEADRMIAMAMEEQVLKILSGIVVPKSQRVTIMFSATMPPSIERIARGHMNNPVIVEVGNPESQGIAKTVDQQFVILPHVKAKEQKMLSIMQEFLPKGPIIIFCNLKDTCDKVYHVLRNARVGNACVLHADKDQEHRQANLKGFKEGTYNILVASDVAGRGIDVEGITLVLNYDAPNGMDKIEALNKYKHRIGRTGRAGRHGTAITFFVQGVKDDGILAQEIAELLFSMGITELDKNFASYVHVVQEDGGGNNSSSGGSGRRGGGGMIFE
jgi:superfamily II DNA/RNA helicase